MSNLHLSSFFGRTVSDVTTDEMTIVHFTDFSIECFTRVSFNHSVDDLVGKKFLYIQKQGKEIFFHFSSEIFITLLADQGDDLYPKCILLKNKEREALIRLDDEVQLTDV